MRNRILIVGISLLIVAALSACGSGLASTVGATEGLTAEGVNAQQPSEEPQTAVPAQQPSSSNLRTISVSGTGEVMLAPDIAYINIGVHSENEDAAQALNDNNTQAQAVIDALTGAGVAAADIQTSNFNIYPSQQYGDNGEIVGTRYMVDNTVYVTVRNLENLGSLLDTVVESGANNINGIQFDVADKTDALRQAREQAVGNARTLAEETVQTAGVTLGEIYSISVNTNSTPIYYSERAMGGGMAVDSAVPIVSGQISVTADVSMVFLIQ